MATDRTPQSTNLCRNRVFLPYSWLNRFIGEKQIYQVGCNQQLGGFQSHGGTPSSHQFSDFPANKPSSELGDPPWLLKVLVNLQSPDIDTKIQTWGHQCCSSELKVNSNPRQFIAISWGAALNHNSGHVLIQSISRPSASYCRHKIAQKKPGEKCMIISMPLGLYVPNITNPSCKIPIRKNGMKHYRLSQRHCCSHVHFRWQMNAVLKFK